MKMFDSFYKSCFYSFVTKLVRQTRNNLRMGPSGVSFSMSCSKSECSSSFTELRGMVFDVVKKHKSV